MNVEDGYIVSAYDFRWASEPDTLPAPPPSPDDTIPAPPPSMPVDSFHLDAADLDEID